MKWLSRGGLAVVLLLAMAGCELVGERAAEIWNNPPRTNIVPPCGRDGVARVELGRPLGGQAQFTTAGGVLYVTAYDFSHGHFGEPPVGSTLLYMGKGRLEDYRLGAKPADALVSVHVVEDDFNKFELPAGTYWIVSSGTGQIAIVSCQAGGVSDAVRPADVQESLERSGG